MATIQADSRDEYFHLCGEKEPLIRTLDTLIQNAAPKLTPVLFKGMTGTWLGYGMQPYQSSSMKTPGEWPIVALAPQKQYVSVYVMAVEDGQYIAEKYADTLGKVSVGKSCIRIKKIEDIDQRALMKLLQKTETLFETGAR